jgi:hypothetical protein
LCRMYQDSGSEESKCRNKQTNLFHYCDIAQESVVGNEWRGAGIRVRLKHRKKMRRSTVVARVHAKNNTILYCSRDAEYYTFSNLYTTRQNKVPSICLSDAYF